MVSISAVIITLNEENNIANAILSVRDWAGEVVVVDMMSEDRTVEIALALGAKVFSHPKVGFVEPARAKAVDYATGEWVLILDADEMVPAELARELQRIAPSASADVCRLPRLNYILGKAMLYGPHAPDVDPQIRFFKKGILRFSDRIHSHPQPAAGARTLTLKYGGKFALHHFHASNAFQLISKMNRYTDTEAEQIIAEGRRAAPWRVALIPPVVFILGFFVHQGWRDGWRGFYWASLMMFYRMTREAKHLSLVEQDQQRSGLPMYAPEAERLLHAYRDS